MWGGAWLFTSIAVKLTLGTYKAVVFTAPSRTLSLAHSNEDPKMRGGGLIAFNLCYKHPPPNLHTHTHTYRAIAGMLNAALLIV